MARTLIQIQSYIFIISQPTVSLQFLNFKKSSYVVFINSIIFIQSDILRWQMGSTTLKELYDVRPLLTPDQSELSSNSSFRLSLARQASAESGIPSSCHLVPLRCTLGVPSDPERGSQEEPKGLQTRSAQLRAVCDLAILSRQSP